MFKDLESDEIKLLTTDPRTVDKIQILQTKYDALIAERKKLKQEEIESKEIVDKLAIEIKEATEKFKQNDIEEEKLLEESKIDMHSNLQAAYATQMHEYIENKSKQLDKDLAEIDAKQKETRLADETHHLEMTNQAAKRHEEEVETLLNEFENYVLREE